MVKVERRYTLLVFEDSVGVTAGYKGIWMDLLNKVGLQDSVVMVKVRSSYLHFRKKEHLEFKKTRKQPGFNTNPNVQRRVEEWVATCIAQHKPDIIACFDPALLFLLNPVWNQATLDTLRGGLYIRFGIPWIVTLPLTAYHSKMKPKDIAKLNQGFTEKGDFQEYLESMHGDDEDSEEDDDVKGPGEYEDDDKSTMEWHEPIIIPYGRIVLEWDFQKVARVMGRIQK